MSSKTSKTTNQAAAVKPPNDDSEHDDSTSSSSDDDDDDDLILEGVLIRNPDVSDSDDTSSEEEEEEDEGGEQEDVEEEDSKPPPNNKSKTSREIEKNSIGSNKPKPEAAKKSTPQKENNKKKKKRKNSGPDIVHVDFIFCDMNEKFFHGLKTMLNTVTPLLAIHSSALADLMIENASVGTVTSTDGDTDGTVFGFASVLNVTTHQDQVCIQSLKKTCMEKCPAAHQKELLVVLSGKTKRPAGFYLHGRMVNMPLEIVQVLHEQLVLDMDWAVKNAEGSEAMRKSLDFGAFILFAPTFKASGTTYYKSFDDEIFASHAEFTFEIELPKPYGSDETPFCNVVVLTKTGHRTAMKSLAEMVGSGGTA
jgi:hypothetical protein